MKEAEKPLAGPAELRRRAALTAHDSAPGLREAIIKECVQICVECGHTDPHLLDRIGRAALTAPVPK